MLDGDHRDMTGTGEMLCVGKEEVRKGYQAGAGMGLATIGAHTACCLDKYRAFVPSAMSAVKEFLCYYPHCLVVMISKLYPTMAINKAGK